MYESFFGLSGPPFQLSPDPAFYFDSRGHSHALAYLKFGVYQGEGFIVVTGEIGAGKTTLVRTLLEGLDAAQVVAAQVVSTQLESTDLLRSILTAFGIPPRGGGSKAELIASFEAFLTALAAAGRRALLIVDEAQNLNSCAIEELRMLSNYQLGRHALLQSFLVGQPELRSLLESPSLEQLRQRVIASCHLGPLDRAETRAYVEHRLHLVGWSGRPRIEPPAFDEIHRWTGGIPRRINLLCNRVLLGAFLAGEEEVSGVQVERIARELRGEVGESAPVPAVPVAPPVLHPVRASAAAAAAGARPRPAAGGRRVLATLDFDPQEPVRSGLVEFVSAIELLQHEIELTWRVQPHTAALLRKLGQELALRAAGVSLLPAADAVAAAALLQQADCLLCGPQRELFDEAGALGLPRLLFQPGGDTEAVPPGVTVARSAEQLACALRELLSDRPARRVVDRAGSPVRLAPPVLARPRAPQSGPAAPLPQYSALLRTSASPSAGEPDRDDAGPAGRTGS